MGIKLIADLKKAWEKRGEIAEGLYNFYISNNAEIKAEAARRTAICESNTCGYFDPEGKPENAVLPGKPSCSICKCNKELKAACMSCYCALKDIGKEPLWDALMTPEQEKEIAQKVWENQFRKNP